MNRDDVKCGPLCCEDVRERASDSLDNALAPSEAAGLERHCTACPECSTLLSVMASVRREMTTFEIGAAPDLADRVLARVPLARPSSIATFRPRAIRRLVSLPRAAGWVAVFLGLAWQLGGGALAARAMEHVTPVVVPVITGARQHFLEQSLRGEGVLGGMGGWSSTASPRKREGS